MKRRGMPAPELREAHRDAFGLEEPLQPGEFNRRQHLYVVGSAANEGLISAVDYWKRQGLSVEFVPYRIYDIAEDRYFEFFSPPYDRHSNPGAIKGVLFDTNRTYGENCVWEMLEKHRVAAYGDVKHVVRYLNPRDIVFFYHKGYGVLAAAEVKRGEVKKNGDDEEYRDVKFLTPVPTRGAPIRALSAAQVSEITGKNFYWARTIKVPYLTGEESKRLLKELKCFLEGQSGPQELTECGAGACG